MRDSHAIEEVEILKRRFEARLQNAKIDVDEAERDLQAATRILAALRGYSGQQTVKVEISNEDDLVAELKTKKTQLQGLVAIARKNNGRLNNKIAKYLLLKSGLMKPTKNAANILYNVINRSERFEHTGPGEYRLKDFFPIRSAAGSVPSPADTARISKEPVQ